jgi:hypothetical protein
MLSGEPWVCIFVRLTPNEPDITLGHLPHLDSGYQSTGLRSKIDAQEEHVMIW